MNANANSLTRRLMEIRFSMWDLHLYLDTHPCDKTAMQLLEKYKEKYCCLLNEYEQQYGALTPMSAAGEEWTKAPWPWKGVCDC